MLQIFSVRPMDTLLNVIPYIPNIIFNQQNLTIKQLT